MLLKLQFLYGSLPWFLPPLVCFLYSSTKFYFFIPNPAKRIMLSLFKLPRGLANFVP